MKLEASKNKESKIDLQEVIDASIRKNIKLIKEKNICLQVLTPYTRGLIPRDNITKTIHQISSAFSNIVTKCTEKQKIRLFVKREKKQDSNITLSFIYKTNKQKQSETLTI